MGNGKLASESIYTQCLEISPPMCQSNQPKGMVVQYVKVFMQLPSPDTPAHYHLLITPEFDSPEALLGLLLLASMTIFSQVFQWQHLCSLQLCHSWWRNIMCSPWPHMNNCRCFNTAQRLELCDVCMLLVCYIDGILFSSHYHLCSVARQLLQTCCSQTISLFYYSQ